MEKIKKYSYFLLFVLFAQVVTAQRMEKYEPEWESLRGRPSPQWFSDAKLGIFVHWGLYSVPSWSGKEQYAEWFLQGLQSGDSGRIAFQDRVFGEDFRYRDYAPLFKGELFDPVEWADLFKRSGAGYVILTSKHHDGYCLWPSKYAPGWNSVDVGPETDIVGALSHAVRNAGLKMGLYYSLPEWNNPLYRWTIDPKEKVDDYVEKHMIPQFKELIATYKPTVLFSDGDWDHPASTWHARELIAYYYNTVGPEAITNDRWGKGSNIGFLTPEYSAGITEKERPWAECRGLGRSFGLNRNEKLDAYMTPRELIHFFVKAVANGGGVTINVGPKADGQIPLLQQERLLQLGEWLQINKEAIYGSRPWVKTGEEKTVHLERVDATIDFNWVRNTPGPPITEDDFTATWTGFISPEFSQQYAFETYADEGMQLWIDRKLILGGNEDSREKEVGRIKLKAGKKYPVKVTYHEEKLEARAHLYWSSEDQQKEIIPMDHLYTTEHKVQGDGLKAHYQSTTQYLVYTTRADQLYAIALEWPGKELVLPIREPAENTVITLLGAELGDTENSLPWTYRDGNLYIDLTGIGVHEIPCQYAWTFKIAGYLQ